jgi:hypothetical protein
MADLDSLKQLAKDALDRGAEVVRSEEVRDSLSKVGRSLVDAGKDLVDTGKAAGRAWSQADPAAKRSGSDAGSVQDAPTADSSDPSI